MNKQVVPKDGSKDAGSRTPTSSTTVRAPQAKATSKAPAKKSSPRGGQAKKRKIEDVITDDEVAEVKGESESENDSDVEMIGFGVNRARSMTVKAETTRAEDIEDED